MAEFNDFLLCRTPDLWIENAVADIPTLLVDHANCEKKAASTAVGLLFRYAAYEDLTFRMSRLAREELRHFEQVQRLMTERCINYVPLTASRYAGRLMKEVRLNEPERLIDTLIVGAFIEARSCERFQVLAPHLDQQLAKFYLGLTASEARHFEHYLMLAKQYAAQDIGPRVDKFAALEADLISQPDTEFRFHSGPVTALVTN